MTSLGWKRTRRSTPAGYPWAVTTKTAAAPDDADAEPGAQAPRATSARPAVGHRSTTPFIITGALIAAYYALTMRALDGLQLHNDLGIQYYLARVTAEGGIPLIDFEHGWNTLSWYYSATLYTLADGNATVWVNLWGRGGFIMAAVAMMVILWRARVPAGWVAGIAPLWIVLTHVAHNKYAIPTIWVAILLPVGTVRVSWQRALRVGLAATVFWAHVELAILLAIGTAMFDLVGRRDAPISERVITMLHAPAGVVVGLVSQIAVYSLVGLPATEFLQQAIGNWTVTDFGPLFDFPILAPETIRLALFPMLMLVPFVPLLWRRLSDPTRLLALCNLALGLIAIRRQGDNHAAAAGTLAALVIALGALDLSREWHAVRAAVARLRPARPATMLAGIGGVAWYMAGIAVGFQVASLAAIVGLTVFALAAVVAERQSQLTASSVGALLAAAAVAVTGVGGHLVDIVGQDDALGETTAITAAVQPELDRCLQGSDSRDVWIVPSPLTLYDTIEVTNPTPFFAFWYNLESERDRIIGLMDDGSIPAILQVGAWPQSMASTVPEIEARYRACASGPVDGSPRDFTVWVQTN